MYEFHPYFTNDGSVGLYSTAFNDIYHSATGALTEAYEKFIFPVDFNNLLQKDKIKVLDICYGIGYNSKSFLNFIFENYCRKNFSKKYSLTKHCIDKIHTNNILHELLNNFIYKNNICNEQIYTNNIFDKISITAIDNDKILSYISPFIKTGVRNFKNVNIDFKYNAIDKFINNKDKISHPKINELINYLIFEKIRENSNDFTQNEELNQVINNPTFSQYFDSNINGIYKSYRYKPYKNNPTRDYLVNLHNIYYRYLSKRYKKRLKRYQLQDINFKLKNDDARKVLLEDHNLYNLIFLDAFTPSKCPCLWSYEFFKLLNEHLEEDGLILTYSTSASIRAAMVEAGFEIGNIYNERLNKFTGTVAAKNKSQIKYPLSEYDLGLLKTKAGIFYRDENLNTLNEAINEARKIEVENSNRISSSHYKKICNQSL